MGTNIDFQQNTNGEFHIFFIDKGLKKVDVGSSLKDFEKIKKLGNGHFGTVYLVKSLKTHKIYAMKEIEADKYKSLTEKQQDEKEIKLLENLDHPHVITYFTSFNENGNLYIITEYINGGCLEDLIIKTKEKKAHIGEKKVWDLLVQSLSGLMYLHENKKIIHRDIKPDNLLLDSEGNLKISDFGCSAMKSENADTLVKCHDTVAGPIQFMAPEVALGMPYDFKSDVYMLGLTFFYLMNYQMAERKVDLFFAIVPVKNKNVTESDFYSDDLKKFIQTLLTQEPSERPSSKEAYINAFAMYSVKYMRTTSIGSVLHCLYGINKISDYFIKGEKIKKLLNDDNEDKYVVTKEFVDAIKIMNPTNYDAGLNGQKLVVFRLLLFENKDRLDSRPELTTSEFLQYLLIKLHKELNKPAPTENNVALTESNVPFERKVSGNIIPLSDKIDFTNEQMVISEIVKKFVNGYRSKISDYFFYLTKTTNWCNSCNNVVRYSSSIHAFMVANPKRSANFAGNKDITVIDLFKHYEKKRLFIEVEEFCKSCNKNITEVQRKITLYTAPKVLIINLVVEEDDLDEYNLKVEEEINLNEYVERKDLSNLNYILSGIIYIDFSDDFLKYSAISKLDNGTWNKYDGKNVTNCKINNINELGPKLRHKVLFYKAKQ